MEDLKSYFRSNSIEVFIKYFDVFERNKNERSNEDIYLAFKRNNETWTSGAFRSRATKGKIIFRLGKEIQALDYIINHAEKIDDKLKDETKKIRARYENIPLINTNISNDDMKLSENDISVTKRVIIKNELSTEENKILVKYRIGQSEYRKKLIRYWGGCAVCGCKQIDVLIASHIKPWNECDEFEKYDLYNGLLLSPNYDKLFDEYLISFDFEGKIMISNKLSDFDLKALGISKDDRILSEKLTLNHLSYLIEHNSIFNGEF